MSPAPPTISLTLTVHNKAWLLPRVLRGLLDNCSPQTRELVIVFDGCTDDSSAVAAATLAARNQKNLSIKTLTTPDVWETKANNVGLRGSSGDYVIIVQDDVVCTEKHFDQRLLAPLLRYPDCFAVGGNCTHHNQLVEGRLQWTELVGKSAWGRRFVWIPHLARALHRRHRLHYRKIFAVRDIVNRSPVLFDHDRLQQLDYFDESFAPLEFDDHDLCLRARRRFGWRCGGCLVDFQSDESWGQLRRSSTSAEVARRARAKNQAQLIERHRDLLLAPKITENRPLA
jgi:glycosyltransferase involved in cell wall biosynthesis